MLNGAATVLDLRSPPGNRLEALRGDLKGFHSIRVNDQWRVVSRWENNGAYDVRLVDYHREEAVHDPGEPYTHASRRHPE